MTFMQPAYALEPVPQNDTPYALVRYVGDKAPREADDDKRRTHPVLFVPGHKGSMSQARSLGSHVARLGLDLEVYALDLNEEPSALHAGLLWQQARFASACVRRLVDLHPGTSVLVVGHSLGGLVIRTALVLPSFPAGAVSTILTLGSPHASPPLHLDRSMATFYDQLSRFWKTEVPRLVAPLAVPVAAAPSTQTNDTWWAWLWGGGDADAAGGSNATNATEAAATADDRATEAAAPIPDSELGSCAEGASMEPASPADPPMEPVAEPSYSEASESNTTARLLSKTSAARAGRRAKRHEAEAEAREARDRRIRFTNARLGSVVLVSISGGAADPTVPPALTSVAGIAPPGQAWGLDAGDVKALAGDASVLLKGGVDHLALAWCFQLQDAVAKALNASAAMPGDASPQDRIVAMRAHLDNGGAPDALGDTSERAWTAELTSLLSEVRDAAAAMALSLVSHRAWLVVPVWAGAGVLLVATPLLHAFLDVASPASALPHPALLLAPSAHFPAFLLVPAWHSFVRSAAQVPKSAVAVSALVHVANMAGALEYLASMDQVTFEGDDGDGGDTLWYKTAAAAVALWLAGCVVEVVTVVLYAAAMPCSMTLLAVRWAVAHFAGPLCLYGAVLVALALVLVVAEKLQAISGGVCRVVVSGPVETLAAAKRSAKRSLAAFFGRMWKKVSGKKEEVQSGDDLREAHRAKNRRGTGSASTASVLLSSERWLLGALLSAFLFLHVASLSPLRLRGMLSLDRSFAQEVATTTIFATGAIAALLVSFVVLPAYSNPDLAKYHLLLLCLYAPLLPLFFGATVHALAVLSRPPGASALTYTSAASLTFDALFDLILLLAVVAHLVLARFRALPLPAPLWNAAGVFPKQLAEGSNGSAATHSIAGSDYSTLVMGSSGSKAWRRAYSWRTGETYYETACGELLYPEGGPTAIFEETDVDVVSLGQGVSLGPCFKVVADKSEQFAELWGCDFAASKDQQRAAEKKKSGNLLEAAAESGDFWLMCSLYGLALFVAIAGCQRAYHASTALGSVAGLLAYRHMSHPPAKHN